MRLLHERSDMKRILRKRIIDNQKQADETVAALHRTDRITVVLVGVGSPLAQDGAQSCIAVFVNGQF